MADIAVCGACRKPIVLEPRLGDKPIRTWGAHEDMWQRVLVCRGCWDYTERLYGTPGNIVVREEPHPP
jgi:hypothetical protein